MGLGWFFHRDQTSVDVFWIGDESLEAFDNLPDPDVLAREIVDELKPPWNGSAKSPQTWAENT